MTPFPLCPEPYHFEKWYSVKEVGELVEKIGLKIGKEDSVLIFPTISIVMPVMIWKLMKNNNKNTNSPMRIGELVNKCVLYNLKEQCFYFKIKTPLVRGCRSV